MIELMFIIIGVLFGVGLFFITLNVNGYKKCYNAKAKEERTIMGRCIGYSMDACSGCPYYFRNVEDK